MIRTTLTEALTAAVKAQDKRRMSTLRLITAALKDRDIDARGNGKGPLSDDEIFGLLAKMIKQRQESATIYADNGRPELAAQEREEIELVLESCISRSPRNARRPDVSSRRSPRTSSPSGCSASSEPYPERRSRARMRARSSSRS
ncbi:MAG: GatB/YqeY domain-containing protein [Chloroflexaceae bacterium]|nr:GatB/YqeY domain-containing protein [Chloroflexaceae bacterium]